MNSTLIVQCTVSKQCSSGWLILIKTKTITVDALSMPREYVGKAATAADNPSPGLINVLPWYMNGATYP